MSTMNLEVTSIICFVSICILSSTVEVTLINISKHDEICLADNVESKAVVLGVLSMNKIGGETSNDVMILCH